MRAVELTLVSDRRRLGEGRTLARAAAEAAAAGLSWIQVREKDLSDRSLLDLAVGVVGAVRGTSARVLVNGRADVATAAGAHGVQLPEDGLPVGEVKRAFPHLVVSASRHSLEGALRARDDGADMLVVGPVFPTPGKAAALGLDELARIVRAAAVPVHAIGGIEPANARRVADAGAAGLAAIRAFIALPPAEAVRAFQEALR